MHAQQKKTARRHGNADGDDGDDNCGGDRYRDADAQYATWQTYGCLRRHGDDNDADDDGDDDSGGGEVMVMMRMPDS